jgi:threonine dehydratase
MPLFDKTELEQAAQLVRTQMLPTPQYVWPLINEAVGTEVWVKHENHTPTGAFKVRGGITFMDWLVREHPGVRGICTATRGNHGQSQARSATAAGLSAKVYVPHGNSTEKNAAMRAFGAELIEFGDDFDIARTEAMRVAEEEGLMIVPPFHPELVRGVATYAYELFTRVSDLDTVYVAIGCGSGVSGLITTRDALGLKTKIVGVVSEEAQTAKLSFDAGQLLETESANTFADGMAVRVPVAEAFEIYSKGAERIVTVTDDEVAEAMRLYFRATHNVAEGAGAASLAALMQERDQMRGRKVAVILTGGNVDTDWYSKVLRGETPSSS